MSDAQKRLDVLITTIGAATSQKELNAVKQELKELIQEYPQLSQRLIEANEAVGQQQKVISKARKELSAYSKEFQGMVNASKKLTNTLKNQAGGLVVGGDRSPTSTLASSMELSQAREILAVQEARGVSAESVARRVVKAAEDEARAQAKAAEDEARAQAKAAEDEARAYQEKINRVIASEEALLRRRRSLADQSSVTQRGRNYSTISVQVDSLIDQRAKESKQFAASLQARLKEEAANQKLAASTNNLAGNLPRLRYALYDVSTSATFTGAAMLGLSVAVAKTSITMDRQFADVVRTTGTYMSDSAMSAGELRDEFNQLFSTLPTTWQALTSIGTLGGQLDVANDSLAEFTSLVTKFSTTTDVSVEASATAFARLSQLLDVSASQYENLGSSILAVGVDSIATESQIISISSQIASMGQFAGMSADEVFGLSATLASLGTQPELSRGVITRLFTNISTSISEGGERLDAFGRIAGVTGQQFATAWGQDATGALQSLLQGLGQLDQTQATQTLAELGITASRDVPTILKLAQNTDVLAKSLDTARTGFEEGTALQEQYGVVATTTAEKLQVLANNFQLFIDSVMTGEGVLGDVANALSEFLKLLTAMQNNPIAEVINAVVISATVLGGVLLVVTGAVTRMGASFLALKTAQADFRQDLVKDALALGVVKTEADAASMSLYRLAVANQKATKTSQAATIATTGLSKSIGGLKAAGAIGAALLVIELATLAVTYAMERAKEAAGEYSQELADALEADRALGASTAIATFTTEVEVSTTSAINNSEALNEVVGSQIALADATGVTTATTQQQTVAINENSDAWVRNELARQFFGDETDGTKQRELIDGLTEALNIYGVTSDQVAAAIETNNQAALDGYRKQAREAYSAADERARLLSFNNGEDLTPEQLDAAVAAQAYADRLAKVNGIYFQFLDVGSKVRADLKSTIDGMYAGERASALFGGSVTGTSEEVETGVSGISEAIQDALDNFSGMMSLALDTENSLSSLGSSLAENGLVWDRYSEAGRSNISALIAVMNALAAETPGDAQAAAANMQQLYNTLIDGGYASISQLSILKNTITQLAGGPVKASGKDMSSFFNGWSTGATKAAKSTKSAAKEVRTLVDYASDLAKVWDRAFDIRFDSQSTLDAITSTFIELQQAAEDSARTIAELQNKISGIDTQLGTQRYFLSIATEYNDSLRAAEIQQQIADLELERSGLVQDLTDEQNANSKALAGNTKAAISNRETITGLVADYEDHIQALAEAGLSSQELVTRTALLKQEFINQATALGFAESEVRSYATAFDDVIVALNNVPKNITVTADVNPALQALNEFLATANNSKATVGVTMDDNVVAYSDAEKKTLYASWVKQYAPGISASASAAAWNTYIANARSKFEQLHGFRAGWASGGYTGRGGKYEYAGAVHKGEYVVPAHMVNQSTGLPKADALGRLVQGAPGRSGYAGGGFVTGFNSDGTVELGMRSIYALARVVTPMLKVGNETIAGAASRGNASAQRIGAY